MVLVIDSGLDSAALAEMRSMLAGGKWADAAQRAILFDIDLAIQSLRDRVGDQDAALVALTGAYHNLLRQWAIP